jgi:hypothetical protein
MFLSGLTQGICLCSAGRQYADPSGVRGLAKKKGVEARFFVGEIQPPQNDNLSAFAFLLSS